MKIDGNHMKGTEIAKDQNLKELENLAKTEDKERLMKVCQEFESIFLNMVFKEMKSTIPESDFVEKTFDREVFESMYIEEMAKVSAKSGGIGLADEIYKSLTREVVRPPVENE